MARTAMIVCKVPGCKRFIGWRGMCIMHYKRYLKTGRAGPIEELNEHHGRSCTKEYYAWTGMLQRCLNPKSQGFRRYGGRGISVCPEWCDSFSAFLSSMGNAPSKEYALDRIDNDGNYEPDNCRWALPIVNGRNRSSTKLTEAKVSQIRNLAFIGIHTSRIAEQFGISKRHARDIIRGTYWPSREVVA